MSSFFKRYFDNAIQYDIFLHTSNGGFMPKGPRAKRIDEACKFLAKNSYRIHLSQKPKRSQADRDADHLEAERRRDIFYSRV